MAFRLNDCVVRGEIDNRLKGHVMGKIWLLDREQPIMLNLQGNCLRDIAGHRFAFENPNPKPIKDLDALHSEQDGVVGDMTASRKVKVFAVPFEEAYERNKRGEDVPLRTANCLYLEWYSERNGRVVIEITNFLVNELSDPEWRMTKEEEQDQAVHNVHAIRDYMERLDKALEQNREQFDPDEFKPMDEFEWEKALKESDALTDKSMEVFDKYMGHPDADKLIAREMGWEWLDDALDADERGVFDQDRAAIEEIDHLEPNPLSEGKDWIRDKHGHVTHPLCHRASELGMDLWHLSEEKGLLGEDGDEDLQEMCFQTQTLGAKLAGALNSLAYRDEPDGGFIVAYLKRALKYLDNAIAASTKVAHKELLDSDYVAGYRKELFDIREEMLRLMKHFRSIR